MHQISLTLISWCVFIGLRKYAHASYIPYMGHAKQNCIFVHAQNAQIQIHPTHPPSHPVICYPLIHSVVSNDSVSGQRRPWSDCADAQADLGFRCPHMPDMFFFFVFFLHCLTIRLTANHGKRIYTLPREAMLSKLVCFPSKKGVNFKKKKKMLPKLMPGTPISHSKFWEKSRSV